MREIKFRAYDKKQKCMCNPEITFSNNRLALDISGYPFFKDMGFDFKNRTYVEDTFEFMQYTGLKDKNGKEIYEGDILSGLAGEDGNVEPLLGVVIWDNGMFILKVISTPEKYYLTTNVFNRTIVRGNIHENPELLPTD